MRYSVLSAPVACSLAIHILALNVGWEIVASDAGTSSPWRRPALRATLVATAATQPVKTAARPPVLPPVPPAAPPLARAESPAPPAVAPQPVEKQVPEAATPAPSAPTEVPSAERPDSAFMDPGGVDEMARPLVEPEIVFPQTKSDKDLAWVLTFDLLIDEHGKVVRVDNISEGPSREIIGAVLAAFYTVPYEPAKLAGQPVAIRQRFVVQPFAPSPGAVKLLGGMGATGPGCAGAC